MWPQQVNGPCQECQEALRASCYGVDEITPIVLGLGGCQDTALACVMEKLKDHDAIHGCYTEESVCAALFAAADERVWEFNGKYSTLAQAKILQIKSRFKSGIFSHHELLDISSAAQRYLQRFLHDRFSNGSANLFSFGPDFMGLFDSCICGYAISEFSNDLGKFEEFESIWKAARFIDLEVESKILKLMKDDSLPAARNVVQHRAMLLDYEILSGAFSRNLGWYTYLEWDDDAGNHRFVPLGLAIADPTISNPTERRKQMKNRVRDKFIHLNQHSDINIRTQFIDLIGESYDRRTDELGMIRYHEKKFCGELSTSDFRDVFGSSNRPGSCESVANLFGFIPFEEVTSWIKPSS
jgi:hypothetical protein